MAARYFVPGGTGNWNSTTNWSNTSGGASGFSYPIAGDTVFLDAASGANTLTVNTTSACTSIDCTGFTGTFAGSSGITISGNVTLDAGMTLTYTGTLTINATSTLTSNGITFNGTLFFNSTSTTTLADNWNVLNVTVGAFAVTTNNNSIYISGSLVFNNGAAQLGTSTLIMNGTGSLSCGTGADVRNNLTFNTSGTITITGTLKYSTGTLTYTAGTMLVTGSTLIINGNCTLNTSSMVWNNFDSFINATVTLTSDLYFVNLNKTSNTIITFNGNNIYISGNLSVATTGFIFGTTNIILNGTGTWSGSGVVGNDLTINTSGTVTVSGTVSYRNGTFTYRRGKVIAGTATLNIAASCTLVNIHKIVFGSVIVLGGQVVTMNEFFSGSANIRTRIASTNTTNYIITFQDGFEKVSKFVKLSNATITNRGQLLVITDKANANTAGAVNLGVRYTNTVPNGISKSNPSANLQACFGIDDGFCAEPLSK